MKVELYKNLVMDQIGQSKGSNFHQPFKSSEVNLHSQDNKADPKQKVDQKEVEKILNSFNEILSQFDLEAKLVYVREYETLVVQVFQKETGKLIRQIPPQELLELSKRLQEFIGLLFKNLA